MCSESGDPPTNTEIIVHPLSMDDVAWAEIEPDPRYSIYHHRAWAQIVEWVFGHRPMYLAALERGAVLDLLPMFLVRYPGLGAKLISTPYEGCYGGFALDESASREHLLTAARELAGSENVKFIEIRSQRPAIGLSEAGYVHSEPLLISEVELYGEDENFAMLSSKHRRNVRTAGKRGVVVSFSDTAEDMRRFYALVARHYHALGLPFFSPRYFDEIRNTLILEGMARLQVAHIGGRFVGGHLLLESGKVLISKYSASTDDPEFRSSYISYAMFWEAIRYGVERGFSSFNMGVTGRQNSGLLDFKSRFGARTSPVHFYLYPLRGGIPDYSELYHGYRLLKRAWSLLPLSVVRPIGHQINRWLC
jgi:CelD/BcsL family acetyltransferase involved in cellulose biosynthesis